MKKKYINLFLCDKQKKKNNKAKIKIVLMNKWNEIIYIIHLKGILTISFIYFI